MRRFLLLALVSLSARADEITPALPAPSPAPPAPPAPVVRRVSVKEAFEMMIRGEIKEVAIQYDEVSVARFPEGRLQLDDTTKALLDQWVRILRSRREIEQVRVDVFGVRGSKDEQVKTIVDYMKRNGIEASRLIRGTVTDKGKPQVQLVVTRVTRQ